MSSATALLLMALLAVTSALHCWRCGQYSDGVGSITPCNNRSATRLELCSPNAKYCIVSIHIKKTLKTTHLYLKHYGLILSQYSHVIRVFSHEKAFMLKLKSFIPAYHLLVFCIASLTFFRLCTYQ